MQQLINKYLTKLDDQGLALKNDAVFLALDAELFSNKPIEGAALELSRVFDCMNINTLLFSEPAEPYWSIIKELANAECRMRNAELNSESKVQNPKPDRIVPIDCETRTFFHDIPVLEAFSAEAITKALSHRKSAIIRDRGIVTYGVVTPEQAFVSFSSTCFSTFVKYFYDSLIYFEECSKNRINPDAEFIENFNRIAQNSELRTPNSELSLMYGHPADEDAVIRMLSEAGRKVVKHRLVDSYFGNISYFYNNKIYISQTGSSMDELEGCIDAVPLDSSSSVGITASSELSAHKNIYLQTGNMAILHGHPKFSVIMSMHCEKEGCDRSLCHKRCSEKRHISGIPIVSGEIGTGPTGLMNTVPEAMKEGKGVIVYGHGVFTAGQDNFHGPFDTLSNIENTCREEYFRMTAGFLVSKKFDPHKLEKLNDPKRLLDMDPDLIWGKLNISNPQTLIDIGAGTGFFAALFAKKMDQGRIFACDISDTMIAWMKDTLSQKLGDAVLPVKMNESSVPLPSGIADLVYMINLHHELEEPVKLAAEAYRLLKDGGKLMIIDWKKEETPEGPPLSIRVTNEDIRSDMLKGGFSHIINHDVLPHHHFVVGEK